MARLITLLTDFGTADGYVGEMKGVLASLAPHASLIDIAHDVTPHAYTFGFKHPVGCDPENRTAIHHARGEHTNVF